jgi:hypothetical protein
MENSITSVYKQQLEQLQLVLLKHTKKRSSLGWWRFIVFAAMVVIAYQVFSTRGAMGIAVLIIGIGILLYLISLDTANNQKITNTRTLIRINEEELQVLSFDYLSRADGSQFTPATHDYANDLDLFGKASLFQYVNRCYTEQGKQLLANNLLEPSSQDKIILRQEAVKELATLLPWRQQMQAFAMQTTITTAMEQKTSEWAKDEKEHFEGSKWTLFVFIYSAITLGSAVAAIFGFIPGAIFSFLFVIYFIAAIVISRNTVKPYILLTGIVKEIETLQTVMQWIEGKAFTSTHLQQLQAQCQGGDKKASKQIQELKAILDRFDMRLSIVGIALLNPLLLWDVRQMMALSRWRKTNKERLPRWFETIAEIEVVNSLTTLHFNNPDWCFPQFSDAHFNYSAKSLGHPLLPATQRVTSDFDLHGVAKIGLVTGSNMAGKSTFLRSLGLSVVLAQMGATACALELQLSPVKLMSSMRIADNLAENTSTFYAELKKLKSIIEAVNRHEKIFILLDEILRGTNSLDRHTGSEALIRQLIHQNAVAVIATHDVELADLQKQFPDALENYHFDVQVEGEELYFDYKLKHGVCTSLNASILMKKIGIEM